MFKLYLLYRQPTEGQFFNEDHYHKVHLGTALEFIGKYRCRRLELGKAIARPPRPNGRPEEWYRSTELYFDTLDDLRACIFSPEMLALNPDAVNYHNVGTAAGFYENEEFDFGPDGVLASASGPWADHFEPRIGQAGRGLPADSPNPILGRQDGGPGATRPGKPGFHRGLVDASSKRPVKSLLLYRPPGDGQFFDEDHYHRRHLATGLEFLGGLGCRRLEIGRSVPVPEFTRPVEWFRYTSIYYDSLETMLEGLPTETMRILSKDEPTYHNVPQSGAWFEREVYEYDDNGLLALAVGEWADYFAERIGKAGLGLPEGSGSTIAPR